MESLGILGPNLLFHIINFLVVMFILNLVLYKPILKVFGERRERISQGLAEAERVREEAAAERSRLEDQLAEERRTSQERLRDAVAKSEEAARRRLDEANAEADEIIGRARSEADERRNEALSGLHGEIADLAMLAASKALAGGIDEARHRELINRFLEQELGDLA